MKTRTEKHERKHKLMNKLPHIQGKMKVLLGLHLFFLLFILTVAGELSYQGKAALFSFLSAMALWILTSLPAGYVAIGLILFMILLNAQPSGVLYQSLSEEVVWLMIGAFIIGEAFKKSGLTDRMSSYVIDRSTSISSAFKGVSAILILTAFFIPSTSGRAALSKPFIDKFGEYLSAKERSTLSLLVPIIILMSTSATLIGAGSHIIGVSLLESTVGEGISFIQWFVWGTPFAVAISVISLYTIKWTLRPKGKEETQASDFTERSDPAAAQKTLGKKEKQTILFIILLVAGWMTESIHHYDIAFVTMVGAFIYMMPRYGVISWKEGIESVSWNLVLFVAAATALGKALGDTGVVSWTQKHMLSFLAVFESSPEWLLVLAILIVTVTSHLYITSHTTRAVVLIPGIILFSQTVGVDPVAMVFISLIGMNYCVTFPVSSKALLLFYEEGKDGIDANDLLKISRILMPLYIGVMMLFYFTYWQWTGM
ncbi:SLC13 family permease [Jeotgalibacillus proteolyticus]|uniref:Citrate:succinate antiporter n=1 Tax=Jeotgalibacillus proteolyticus TaxID=2082395 RepID=A0A2S5G908_9BACL|nr:SLC13 family permease [Jeotgalibacillus proteolyticus]PPA69425.1 citrate:succinate antiporter [Jeotgalibacillus proteolyticus]